ncbi:uncharacterized protein LOC141907308 isoform X2 [Tubulanus polymorphus]
MGDSDDLELVNGDVVVNTRIENSEHPGKPDMKVFDSLSSKIEDELRMLDWEMSSNIQDDVISDILGKKCLTDMCMHDLPDIKNNDQGVEASENGELPNGYHGSLAENEPMNKPPVDVKLLSPSKRRKLRKKDRAASRETLGSNTRSSVSSMSSNWDDDVDDMAAFGDDEHNASETGSSCSSNEYGVADEERRLAELQATELPPITVLANRYLEDLERVKFARNMAKIDRFARIMVNNALREVNTLFPNVDDSQYWSQLFMDDSTLVGNIVFDSIPFPFELRGAEASSCNQLAENAPPPPPPVAHQQDTEVIFSKKFTTDNVIFTDVPVFKINSEIALKAVDKPQNKYEVYVETEADSPESIKSRRMLQRARFQMHDLQVELRKLKQQMTVENKVESFVMINGNEHANGEDDC